MEPKKTFKPLRFNAKTTWQSARRAILSGAGKPDVVVGVARVVKEEQAPEAVSNGGSADAPSAESPVEEGQEDGEEG